VAVGVGVKVAVGVGVSVAVAVGVSVGVEVYVAVGVLVAVRLLVAVGLLVLEGVGVFDGVGVLDGVGVSDGVGVVVGVPGTAVSVTSSTCGERMSLVVLKFRRYCKKRPGGLVTANENALLGALQADQLIWSPDVRVSTETDVSAGSEPFQVSVDQVTGWPASTGQLTKAPLGVRY
jgi:hypothetical protein